MEALAYTLVAAGAYLALLIRSRGAVYACALFFVLYSLFLRSSEADNDLVIYYESATNWPPLSLYYLREPVLWFGSSLLYTLTNNVVIVFVIMDVLSVVLVLWVMDALDDGDNRLFCLAPTLLASYVFLLGQQNVLRQHLALIMFLCALTLRSRTTTGSFFLFVVAFLSHNLTALLFGYWVDAGRIGRRRYGPLISLTSVIALYFVRALVRKSGAETGMETGYLYVAVAVAIAMFLWYANLGRVRWFDHRAAALSNFLAFAPASLFLWSAQFERVAMVFFFLLVIELYRFRGALRIGKAEVAQVAYGALVLPVLLFPSVYTKLL